jgi:hypothetical protein
VLYLSEHAAYGRIEAARCARCPQILDLLAEGAVTLTTIGLLAPHLTSDNADELLTAARHKSKREVEHLVAARSPLPPVRSSVRKLPRPLTRGGIRPELRFWPARQACRAVRAARYPHEAVFVRFIAFGDR